MRGATAVTRPPMAAANRRSVAGRTVKAAADSELLEPAGQWRPMTNGQDSITETRRFPVQGMLGDGTTANHPQMSVNRGSAGLMGGRRMTKA